MSVRHIIKEGVFYGMTQHRFLYTCPSCGFTDEIVTRDPQSVFQENHAHMAEEHGKKYHFDKEHK